MSDESIDNDDNIEDLLSQLQDVNSVPSREADPSIELNSENVEQFIIDSAGVLIQKSLIAVDDIKQYVLSAPDSDQIESLAALIKSSASAIDTLNKLVLQDKKAKASHELKELDFKQKKQLQAEQTNQLTATLLMSREEMVKQLLSEAEIIDAEVSDVSGSSKDEY